MGFPLDAHAIVRSARLPRQRVAAHQRRLGCRPEPQDDKLSGERRGNGLPVRGLEHSRPTGLFFDRQEPQAIADAVLTFERNQERILAADCRTNALRFSTQIFRETYSRFVEQCWDAFRGTSTRAWPERRVGNG